MKGTIIIMTGYQRQVEFLDWEFGIFFHFGIRSFYPGHRDWDGIEMPAEGFDPKELDCEQWIRISKEAGATYIASSPLDIVNVLRLYKKKRKVKTEEQPEENA